MSHVMFMTTVHDAWMALERMFASRSKARILQIRFQLSNLRKEQSDDAYFHQMKTLVDTLAAIGQPLCEEEVISYILDDLRPIMILVTSIITRSDYITIDDMYAHLQSYKLH